MRGAVLVGFRVPFLCRLCQAAFPPAGRGLLHAVVAEQGRLERLSARVQEHRAGHGGPAGLGLGPKHAFSVSVQPRSL